MIPRSTLSYLLDRLRLNYVHKSLYSDEDVLVFLNDGYAEACERSQCLIDVGTILTVQGTNTYPLPADFAELVFVCSEGMQLSPLPYAEALGRHHHGYYLLGNEISLVLPRSLGAGSTMFLYVARPAPLLNYDSAFDPRFPIEFSDLLVYFVRWRVNMLSGGAERIRLAGVDRGLYEQRLGELAKTTNTVTQLSPTRLEHASQRMRSRDAC